MTATSGSTRIDELGTILGVWAHPDDECYLMAGTAMLASATGSHVACLTATAGEAGETSDEARWPRAQLATIRRAELAASLDLLGIADHSWLDLADGELDQVDPERGIDLVGAVVERVRPDTILTFGPDGMTGHPDHVAIGAWALDAARRVTSRPRVLQATKGHRWGQRFSDMNQSFGFDLPRTPDEAVALHVELTGDLLDQKVAALHIQASQTAALSDAVGRDTYTAWVADEFWVPAG